MQQQARRQARMRNSSVVVTRIGLTVLLHLTAALVLSSLSMGRPPAPRRRLDPALASEFLPLKHRRDHAAKVFCKGFRSAVEKRLVFQELEACPIMALSLLLLFVVVVFFFF